jgi:hypothetical protein
MVWYQRENGTYKQSPKCQWVRRIDQDASEGRQRELLFIHLVGHNRWDIREKIGDNEAICVDDGMAEEGIDSDIE